MIYHFKIYQVDSKDIAKRAYLFEPYRRIKDRFSIDNYKLVYEDDYHIELENIDIPLTYVLFFEFLYSSVSYHCLYLMQRVEIRCRVSCALLVGPLNR